MPFINISRENEYIQVLSPGQQPKSPLQMVGRDINYAS